MTEPPENIVISHAKLRGREGLYRIEIEDGKYKSITEQDPSSSPAACDLQAEGHLVIPQFCENHIHLDYVFTAGKPRANVSGTLFEAIEIWRERKELDLNRTEDIKREAIAAARSCVGHGVGYIRSHVDVSDPKLTALGALLEVKEEIKDWCELQLVAFPQNGIFATKNGMHLMEKAMEMGADIVGGIPHIEPTYTDGVNSLKFIFDLAQTHGAMVDVHCDEIDDAQSRFIDVMAAETSKRELQGRVTVSHAVAMGYYPPGYIARLMPKLQAAGIGFAIAPRENLQLQGRDFNAPVPRGIAPVRTIVDCGIPLAFCQDSICDPWYPVGDGNPVRNLDAGMHTSHMLSSKYMVNCLDYITKYPARNMGVQDHDVKEGNLASCIILDASSDEEALRLQPVVLASIHKGKTVFTQTRPQMSWSM